MSTQTPNRHPTQQVTRSGTAQTSDAIGQPIQSSDLFNGGKSICIEHRGEIYRLQTTKLGKLILTK